MNLFLIFKLILPLTVFLLQSLEYLLPLVSNNFDDFVIKGKVPFIFY
jgi:hypothetical protein